MALELTPTSELEAVNEMLTTIGEMQVNDLDAVTGADTAIARDLLRAISREVQSKGWWFNEDEAFVFTLNADGRVQTPSNILSMRPTRRGQSLATRNGFLWDRRAQTDTFPSPPLSDVVWFFPFEELPETARRYITVRACRIFQVKVLGSETQNVFTSEHEDEAYMLFASEQNDFTYADGHNFLNDSGSVTDIWDV